MQSELSVARLLKVAEEQGKDQQDIYEGVGVTRQTFQNWKARGHVPSNWFAPLARFLHLSVEELLGTKPMSPKDWPFKTIAPGRLYALSPGERMRLEGVLLDELLAIEAGRRSKRPRNIG